MTVYFIGAGPGDPDLITIRGRDLIAHCPVCLYAGSLVPEAVVAYAPPGARLINTANLKLDEIIEELAIAHRAGRDVARVHSGDTSIYSALGEQISALEKLEIPYKIVPGVPAFAAAAAELGLELTLPGVAQSVILTRTAKNSSPMPDGEALEELARSRATLAIHLSARRIGEIADRLIPIYGAMCPAAIVARASRPDQSIVRGNLANIAQRAAGIERTALILVGPALAGGADNPVASSVYAG